MSKIFLASVLGLAVTGTFLLPASGCSERASSEGTATTSSALADPAKRGEVVISKVYGGGGNAGGFRRDFIEVFNRSQKTVGLTGLSVQVTTHDQDFSGANVIELAGDLEAGKSYLIAGPDGADGDALPNPIDKETDVSIPVTQGKIALVPGTTAVSCVNDAGLNRCGNNTAKVIDFVGYGNASDFEGTQAQVPALSGTTVAIRKGKGCTDADNNFGDFTVGKEAPRNLAAAAEKCPAPDGGVDAGTDARPPAEAGPPPKFEDPPLGEETPFDAGVRRDGGSPTAASGAEAGDCNVTAVGSDRAAEVSAFALALVVGMAFVARRRRNDSDPR